MKTIVNSSAMFLLTFFTAFALSSWTGKVVGITDGDTFQVMHDGKAEKIRLQGIDAPESGQPWGNKAKQLASKLAFGQNVTVNPITIDKYGRTVAEIILPDGKSVNQILVQEGLAWWYREYAPDDKTLASLELEAKDMGRGLWSDPNPVAPWDWRHGGGKTAVSTSNSEQTTADVSSEQVFKTVSGKKYHRDGCRYLKSRIPTTVKDALAAGLTPCGVCCPPTGETTGDNATLESSSSGSQNIQSQPYTQPSGGGRCQATTKKGTQCKRMAKPGSNYCWQHGG
ncbi:MAG: thermonuclease family protein [Chitinispirillaceae bacterium]|nr:thermonuclease family protein [Chitinispirillaceae bacterium]